MQSLRLRMRSFARALALNFGLISFMMYIDHDAYAWYFRRFVCQMIMIKIIENMCMILIHKITHVSARKYVRERERECVLSNEHQNMLRAWG